VNVNVAAVYMREGERGVTVSVSLHCLESVGVVDSNSFEVLARVLLGRETKEKKENKS